MISKSRHQDIAKATYLFFAKLQTRVCPYISLIFFRSWYQKLTLVLKPCSKSSTESSGNNAKSKDPTEIKLTPLLKALLDLRNSLLQVVTGRRPWLAWLRQTRGLSIKPAIDAQKDGLGVNNVGVKIAKTYALGSYELVRPVGSTCQASSWRLISLVYGHAESHRSLREDMASRQV